MKNGQSTTEFWVTMALMLLGVIATAIGAAISNDTLTAVGAALTALSGGAYSISRGIAKSGEGAAAASGAAIGKGIESLVGAALPFVLGGLSQGPDSHPPPSQSGPAPSISPRTSETAGPGPRREDAPTSPPA